MTLGELRRGLPRVPGGELWPPVNAATKLMEGSRAGVGLRRGLPRLPGGEPWPTSNVVAAFEVQMPALLEDSQSTAAASVTVEVNTQVVAVKPASAATAAAQEVRPSSPSPPGRVSRFDSDRLVGRIAVVLAGAAVIGVLVAAIVIGVRVFLFHTAVGTDFIHAFPGQTPLPPWAPVGQPLWAQWQHWLNAFFLVLIIKTGWTVRTQKRPSSAWRPRHGGKKISIELWTHLSLDLLWIINGAIFVILLFSTREFIRVVPYSWQIFPNALSALLQYVSLSWPVEDGWVNYNSLQVLAYFVTIFVAAPLAAISGYRMSPLWPSKARRLSTMYPLALARKIHFPTMLYFVLFVIVHVVLVLATGALRNLNHMFWGSDDPGDWIGFAMFMLGIAAIVAGWFAVRPLIMQRVGAAFGTVGR